MAEEETSPKPQEQVTPTPAPKTAMQLAAEKAEQAKQAAVAQAAENLAMQAKYKGMIGKRFTNGKQIAEVREYVPSRLTELGGGKSEPRQCFIVNFGHKHVSFYRPCLEFTAEFSSDAGNEEPQIIDMNPVNLPK